MTDETYNGYTNRQTWNVSLWLDNDEGLYNQVNELVADTMIDEDDREHGVYRIAEALSVFVDDLAEMTCPGCIEGASFVSDLLGHALAQVDWYEIAENLLSESVDA